MKPLLVLLLLIAAPGAGAQSLRARCTERSWKSEDSAITDPIIRTTCYLKSFRFQKTAYADYSGKYYEDGFSVFMRVKDRWVRTRNSRVFNKQQGRLLAGINRRIREDWNFLRGDRENDRCFSDDDVLPVYRMDDLRISLSKNSISFSVEWNSSWACRPVSGSTVTYSLKAIAKYLR
ncbi:MAG: hypothetical protein EOO11_13030 [Chitinophagaceae bacterium]|nr:MAG: hypothetical protein EOO11_13030 [Chitinophagaceae bacterium]